LFYKGVKQMFGNNRVCTVFLTSQLVKTVPEMCQISLETSSFMLQSLTGYIHSKNAGLF